MLSSLLQSSTSRMMPIARGTSSPHSPPHPVPSAGQRPARWTPLPTAATASAGSSSSSPDEPLTVQRTHRRAPKPRRIVMSDTDDDGSPNEACKAPASCSSTRQDGPQSLGLGSQGRRSPARLPLAPPLLDVTNHGPAPSKPPTPTTLGPHSAEALASPMPGRSGIFELAALLGRTGNSAAPSRGFPETGPARAQTHRPWPSPGASDRSAATAAPDVGGATGAPPSQDPQAHATTSHSASSPRSASSAGPHDFASASPATDLVSARSLRTGSSGEDDEDVPLAFTRSVRVPRSRRRILLDDSPNSQSCGTLGRYASPAVAYSPPSASALPFAEQSAAGWETHAPSSAGRPIVDAALGSGTANAAAALTPSPGHADSAAGAAFASPVASGGAAEFGTPASRGASRSSSASFHSPSGGPLVEPEHGHLASMGQSPSLVPVDEAVATAATTAAVAASASPVRTGTPHLSAQQDADAPAPSSSAAAAGPAEPGTAGAWRLAQVPRRRQRQPGRDVAGEAAAASAAGAGLQACSAGGGSGGFTEQAGTADPDGLMYDLYGELLLESQLRGLSLGGGDEEGAASEEAWGSPAEPSRLASPSGRSEPAGHIEGLQPAPLEAHAGVALGAGAGSLMIHTGRLDVMDLTLGSSDRSIASGGAADASGSGRGGRSVQLNRSSMPSPAGLLEAYREGRSGGGARKAEIAVSAGTLAGAPSGHALPSRSGRGASSDEEGDAAPCWRPGNGTVIGRRRAVILDSSSDGSPASSPAARTAPPRPAGPSRALVLDGSPATPRGETSRRTRGGRTGAAGSPPSDPYALPSSPSSPGASTDSGDDGAGADQDKGGPFTPRGQRLQRPGLLRGVPPSSDEEDDDAEDDEDGEEEALPFLHLPQLLPPHATATDGLLEAARKRAGGGRGRGAARPAGRPPATVGGPSAAQAERAAKASKRAFLADRDRIARELYSKWNDAVFEGRLPAALPLVWNPRLVSTAGQVVAERELKGVARRVAAKLELSSKIIDNIDRLRNTLSHEMCHVAAWHLSREFDRPHGPAWEKWCRHFEQLVPGLAISRTHDYIASYRHRWRCTRPDCRKEYGRQRQSIKVDMHVCAACRGPLEYVGRFDKQGRLLAAPAGAGGGASGLHGAPPTTGKGKTNTYAQFLKDNFGSVKKSMPAKTPNTVIFKAISQMWHAAKPSDDSARPGAATSPGGAGTHAPYLRRDSSSGGSRRRSGQGSGFSGRTVGRLSHETDDLVPRMCDLSLAADGE